MRLLVSLFVLAAAPACRSGDDDGGGDDGATDDGTTDDGSTDDGSTDDGGEPDCVADELRDERAAVLSGAVTDHESGAPVAGAEVSISTAWDTSAAFPIDCPVLDVLATDEDGRFGPAQVELGTPLSPPIALFLVTGGDLADTASDQRLVCDTAGCDDLDHAITAPARELADGWRTELARGGMDDAGTRGLVLFSFRNVDGTPADGVTAWSGIFEATRLEPGSQVRYLEPDRVTLAPPDTQRTTASGLALIGVDTDDYVGLFVSGSRGAESWEETGVLLPPGWIFLEDKQQSP